VAGGSRLSIDLDVVHATSLATRTPPGATQFEIRSSTDTALSLTLLHSSPL
jgi:hypothetical protein